MTPLIAATLENDTDLVNMLLKKGADANQKDGVSNKVSGHVVARSHNCTMNMITVSAFCHTLCCSMGQ
jgi:hypothetical protein